MEVVLVGIAGIAAMVVVLILFGVHAVCSAGGFMRYDDPF